MRIDSHQHFWRYNKEEYVWMSENQDSLRRDFLPEDLAPLLSSIDFDGAVAVQARQSVGETEWLLELSKQYSIIKGVVGWVDLCSPDIRLQLEKYASHSMLKGVRHLVHDEPSDTFMLRSDFQRGITALEDFGLTYDLLIFPKHLPYAIELVNKFPNQRFVLDHIGKPDIKNNRFHTWKEDINRLAKFENVFCKLSGMVTETKWRCWEEQDFSPYMNILTDAFGLDRLMIGSDWPVCTISGNYKSVMEIVINYIKKLTIDEQEKILGGNCMRFYNIEQ
jgi:L-fuconolactonase